MTTERWADSTGLINAIVECLYELPPKELGRIAQQLDINTKDFVYIVSEDGLTRLSDRS